MQDKFARGEGGFTMMWLLVVAGLALVGAGFWGGLRPKEPPQQPLENVTVDSAWEIISRPVDRREPQVPGPRSGPDRRFLNGLLVGLGSGLLLSAVAIQLVPRAAVPVKPQAPVAEAPPAAITPPPPQAPPKPANVTFVVEVGDMGPTVAANLKAAGLIADEQAFLDRITGLGVDTLLKAGTFIIPTGASLDEVITALMS